MFWKRFFKESSEEEREHAEKLMEYQVFYFDLFYILNLNFEGVVSMYLLYFIFRTSVVEKWSCSQLWCRFLSLIMQIKGMHCTVSVLAIWFLFLVFSVQILCWNFFLLLLFSVYMDLKCDMCLVCGFDCWNLTSFSIVTRIGILSRYNTL